MPIATIIALIESGLRIGETATNIVQRLCSEHGGEAIPSIEEFEAHIERVRELPDLTPKAE